MRQLLGNRPSDKLTSGPHMDNPLISKRQFLEPLAAMATEDIVRGSEAFDIGILQLLLGEILHEVLSVSLTYSAELGQYIRALTKCVPVEGEYGDLHEPSSLEMICAVAALHDIGHLAIPSEILLKRGSIDRQAHDFGDPSRNRKQLGAICCGGPRR